MNTDLIQQQWQSSRIDLVPAPWRSRVKAAHDKRMVAAAASYYIDHGEQTRRANLWLLQTTERIAGIKVPITLTDEQLRDMASERAARCARLAEIVPGVYYTDTASLRRRMAGYVQRYGIKPPAQEIQDSNAIARMVCEQWWRRQLRKTQARGLEREAINLGYVSEIQEQYASSITVERRTQQRKRNASLLQEAAAVNLDTGELYTLAELAAKSVSNPGIRRGELMTRIKGFEAISQVMGHAAEFITLTAPSKYHAKTTTDNGQVVDNKRYEGATPRETQRYLNTVWCRIRARLQRLGIRVYGFRITEAHADGTPHWHLLLFLNVDRVEELKKEFREYALKENGDEPGAKKHRVKFVSIDRSKGTATGYVAKYVSRNIDQTGIQVQRDHQGDDAIVPSQRVEAWASTWGIRQFQQIGGPPVGVWRELRRTKKSDDMIAALQQAIVAADKGDWSGYLTAMGGPTVERRNLPLRVAYTRPGERWNYQTQEPYPAADGKYGELASPAIIGIKEVKRERLHQSRRYRWRIEPSKAPAAGYARHNYIDPAALAEGPWTRVNNCTVDNFNPSVDKYADGFNPVDKVLKRGFNREKQRIEPQNRSLFDGEEEFDSPPTGEELWRSRPLHHANWSQTIN